jgi:Uma2 family endonuclease
MTAVVDKPKVTPEDLLKLPRDRRYELVDGELVEKPMSAMAGAVCAELLFRLGTFLESTRQGTLFSADTGYQCFVKSPDKIRKPDISFIRKERITADLWKQGFIRIPPDLVVEVLSPSDSTSETERRVDDYLDAGVPLVWVVQPETRRVYVYRHGGTGLILREQDELTGEPVLPGFRLPVREIFRPLEQLTQQPSQTK